MPYSSITPEEKEKLQSFYLACRKLVKDKIIPVICAQRSFEEALSGFTSDDTWRPTHISKEALKCAANGSNRELQRAHGVLEDRLDRYKRTSILLLDEEKDFNSWWEFYIKHDKTVLITKKEHDSGKKFSIEDLIPIPQDTDLFKRGGFSFRFRKKHELFWSKKQVAV